MPRDQWPAWVTLMSIAAIESDKGFGDVIARIIGPTNSAAFKAWHFKKFGRSCGCEQRQPELNAKYPFS